MSLIRFTKKCYRSKLPNLTLCYSTTMFYRLPVPTDIKGHNQERPRYRYIAN